ncbi:MAG: hypothetical protein BWX50_01446 [Euryarchaeota archaeon ADurb.Bin009]|nr:MAG: hypothetical protein BWX50_01446 [Euryarchaeota archaeon ADurb.Bin009]
MQTVRSIPNWRIPSTFPPSRCFRSSIAKLGGFFGGTGNSAVKWARLPVSTSSWYFARSSPFSLIPRVFASNW